ncbi:hypothetical protein ABZ721_23895 [Streptomyces sp. NPDC006733]|uniref:trypsin-like serine peptidase n=1 Tax=Streptomyces sp. NPDC006733 TaxID=3155460 RepID=UPI0033EE160C
MRGAADFFNPVINGLWGTARMRDAAAADGTVGSTSSQGISDPAPSPVEAEAEISPYSGVAKAIGKIFFDTPRGPAVCSGTVVKDPANPGQSNLVWTAGHCVHAGEQGGWFRNIVFVPDFLDSDTQTPDADDPASQTATEVAPFGTWWADLAQTSQQWITTGTAEGGSGAPYDFAVMHVKPEPGNTRSLEETVGIALPVDFNAGPIENAPALATWGYPAKPPFDGRTMWRCLSSPGRLSIASDQPSMYRMGCTMTGGSSGGGWIEDGPGEVAALVSNTSIGPNPPTWLAGPHLGVEAQNVYHAVSEGARAR